MGIQSVAVFSNQQACILHGMRGGAKNAPGIVAG
jgi:hypothetical protein